MNFTDFAIFAPAWDANDTNITLDDDNDVDIDDLKLFCDVWLWTAPWMEEYQQMMAMGGESGMMMPAPEEMFMADALESTPVQPDVMTIIEPPPIGEPQASRPSSRGVSPEADPPSIEEIIAWLDATWNAGDFAGVMTYDEYLAFRQQLEEMIE